MRAASQLGPLIACEFLLPAECSIDSALRRGFNDLLYVLGLKLILRELLLLVKSLRLIMIGWMVLWLAGNGVLAVAMPYCKHAAGEHGDAAARVQDRVLAAQQAVHAAHQHDHHQHSANTQGHNGDHKALSVFCDSCDLCHLAASAVPVATSADGLAPAEQIHPIATDVTIPSRFIELPQPVPLATRA